jgi:hypothetical protein
MTASLSTDQIDYFHEHGYLILRDLLSGEEVDRLKEWAQEVHDWKATPDSIFMPYEVRCNTLTI